MAPLPDNNTQRLFIDYEGSTGQHTTMVRPSANLDFSAVVALGQTLWDIIRPLMTDETVATALRYSGPGQNFSIDLAAPTGTGTGGLPPAQNLYPLFISFIGRSTGGRRSRIFVFNTSIGPDNDYRSPVGQNANITTAINAITALTTSLVAIDGLPIVWKDYANQGYNAYYQRKRRAVS